MVELASGSVSFCGEHCSTIGKLAPIDGVAASILDGGDQRFFVTNASSGAIALCTVDMEYRDDHWVFKSGKCTDVPRSSPEGAEGSATTP